MRRHCRKEENGFVNPEYLQRTMLNTLGNKNKTAFGNHMTFPRVLRLNLTIKLIGIVGIAAIKSKNLIGIMGMLRYPHNIRIGFVKP